jgi:hypothetical protein
MVEQLDGYVYEDIAMNKMIKAAAKKAGFGLWGKEKWNPGDVIDWSSRYDDQLIKFVDVILNHVIKTLKQTDIPLTNEQIALIRKMFKD